MDQSVMPFPNAFIISAVTIYQITTSSPSSMPVPFVPPATQRRSFIALGRKTKGGKHRRLSWMLFLQFEWVGETRCSPTPPFLLHSLQMEGRPCLLFKGSCGDLCLHSIKARLEKLPRAGKSTSREDWNSQRAGKICIILIWLLTVMKSEQTFINKPFHTSSALSSWAQHRQTDYNAVTLSSFPCLS